MPSKGTIKINDYTPEPSTVTAQGLTLTAANFDAVVSAWTDFRAGVGGITRGLIISHQIGNPVQVIANGKAPAADPEAQREEKWLVRYHGATTGLPHRMELPCADMQYLDPNNRGFADPDDPAVAAFIGYFEVFVKEDDGSAVVVDSIAHLGANT